MPDLYEVLGLDSGATQDQVKAAFHRLAKASHPDLNADDATAEKRFKKINHAYEILSNPGTRAAYDLGLTHKRAKGHRAMGRAIGSMAAAFLLTIGGGLYFWHASRQLADHHVPTEVSKKYGGPNTQPKQDGARQRAEDLVEVGSKTFSDTMPPASDNGSRGKSANSQPTASPAAEPKATNVPVREREQTEVATRPRAASPKTSTPGRQVECERALRLHVKGLQMMEVGDMVAARPLFERAADAGLCRSAWELARTYDPVELNKLDVRLAPDAETAQKWYQKARDLCATELPLCAAADADLAKFRAAYTSGDGLAYVLLNNKEGERIYRFGDESRLAAEQGMGEYKLFTCNTPRVFTTRNAEDKAALLTATVVKPGDPRFAELDAKYVSGCNDIVPSAIPKN
jgi:curved DNA-binding protein CbpA